MDYGLTDTGFVPKTLEVCKSEWEAELRSRFGDGINLEPESVEGQIVGIAAEREALLWEQAEAIYNADRPDGATGISQDTLYALTGAMRLQATRSIVIVIATGNPTTVLQQGRVVSVEGSGAKFTSQAQAIIIAVNTWQPTHSYALNERVTLGNSVYQCIVPGISSTIGPAGNGADIVDGSAHWRFLGPGTGAVDLLFESNDLGPIPAYSSTLTKIETPVSGWNGAINLLDATIGRAIETDAAFRLRRELLLRAQGNAAVDAIRSAVFTVDGVTACSVFENTTLQIDSNGLPPKSIEVLVQGGTDDDVALAIWKSKPGGIETFGNQIIQVTDSQGSPRTIRFSRPNLISIYVVVTGTKDPKRYPANGDAQIKDALVQWAASNLGLGDDVVSSALIPAIFSISGVIDCQLPLIEISNPPANNATIELDTRSRAVFDTSRITVSFL